MKAQMSRRTDGPPSRGGRAVFLDFDGCLVALAPRPQDVAVPRRLPGLLSRLSRRCGGAVALVSGRSVAELRRFLPGLDVTLVGSHGGEWARGAGPVRRHAIDRDAMAEVQEEADRVVADWPGALLEDKPLGFALHSRQAPERAGDLHRLATRLADSLPDHHLHEGKAVLEIRPDGVGKGHAVARLMRQAPFLGRIPVMAGDDRTDEPAFAVVNARGGLSIKIGAGPTCARARLATPAHLHGFLAAWAREDAA